jgi:mannitol 2-dehydrogenase
VIEDEVLRRAPDWDRVGATFTDDVHAYEMMKIRILNAGHQVLANAGELLSLATIAGLHGDPAVSALLPQGADQRDPAPCQPVPGMTPAAYLTLIEGRFANPAIRDTTRRVAFDGSSRHTGFVLPILRDGIAAGVGERPCAGGGALGAHVRGHAGGRHAIEPNDPQWTALQEAAETARTRPRAWLEQAAIYGDLAANPAFAEAFERWLILIWHEGTAAALATFLRDP